MNTYKISSENGDPYAGLKEVLVALEKGFSKFGIDFYLVGAVSRDLWMTGIHNIKARRATSDMDFAVYINEKGKYEALKEYLIANESFRDSHENGFVLIHGTGTEVDLLPFGAIEDENRRITIKGTGYTSIHVDGLKEVFQEAVSEIVMEGIAPFKCSTLPGIIVLKLIAWDDRPEHRRSDIEDIADILNNLFSIYEEAIYTDHLDLFEAEDRTLLQISARVLGRDIKKIVRISPSLEKRIQRILKENISDPDTSSMGKIMSQYFDNTIEANIQLIAEIIKGMAE